MSKYSILATVSLLIVLGACNDTESSFVQPDTDYIETIEEANSRGVQIVDNTADEGQIELLMDDNWVDDGVYSDEYKDGLKTQEWVVEYSKGSFDIGMLYISTKTDNVILHGVAINDGKCYATINRKMPTSLTVFEELVVYSACKNSDIHTVTLMTDLGEIPVTMKSDSK